MQIIVILACLAAYADDGPSSLSVFAGRARPRSAKSEAAAALSPSRAFSCLIRDIILEMLSLFRVEMRGTYQPHCIGWFCRSLKANVLCWLGHEFECKFVDQINLKLVSQHFCSAVGYL